jgi:hypothetical protein
VLTGPGAGKLAESRDGDKRGNVARPDGGEVPLVSTRSRQVRLLAEAPCKEVVDVLGDVAAAAVAEACYRCWFPTE